MLLSSFKQLYLINNDYIATMKKSEMFDVILRKVCEECEVREESIINGTKMQSVVDARMLVVQYARRIGLSNDEIALIVLRKLAGTNDYFPEPSEIKSKSKGVDQLFKGYSDRCLQSRAFVLQSIDINTYVQGTFFE